MLVVLFVLALELVTAAVSVTCKQPGQIALTFDHGPGYLTGRLLDILQHKQVRATFHINVDLMRNTTLVEYVRRAQFHNHTIGLFVPDGLIAESNEGEEDVWARAVPLFEYIHRGTNWLTNILGGQAPKYIRFATKRALPQALRKAIENLGYTITKAKLEIRDENNKMDSIWNSLGRGLANSSPRNNSFILKQRDIMPNSVHSVDRIIDYVQEKGYILVPLEECVPAVVKGAAKKP